MDRRHGNFSVDFKTQTIEVVDEMFDVDNKPLIIPYSRVCPGHQRKEIEASAANKDMSSFLYCSFVMMIFPPTGVNMSVPVNVKNEYGRQRGRVKEGETN